jgi:hypothetical protein
VFNVVVVVVVVVVAAAAADDDDVVIDSVRKLLDTSSYKDRNQCSAEMIPGDIFLYRQ